MAKSKLTESDWLSRSEAARRLGVSRQTLARAGRHHELYRETSVGLPGVSSRGSRAWYHRRQIDLIEDVRLGRMDFETASLEWHVFCRRRPSDSNGVGR